MKKVNIRKGCLDAVRFRQYQNSPYAAFASLKREVTIGVLAFTTLTFANSGLISAQDVNQTVDKLYELQEVQVTATRAPLTAAQSARMVTVLDSVSIASAPVQSVNDLLKYAIGVDVRQRGPIGAQTDVSIRGGNYEQITILLNGINICDPQTGHNAFDLPVDISEIERIEVLEGPAGRVYGTSSLLGAINIVTKTPSQSSLSVHADGGSYGYFSGGGRANVARGKWNNQISGSYTHSDGYSRSKNGHLNMDYSGGRAFYQGNYNDDDISVKWHAGISMRGWGSNTFYSTYSDEQYEHTLKTYTAIQGENKNGKVHFHPSIYWNRTMDRFELFRDDPDSYPFNYHRTDVFGLNLNGYFNWILGRTAFGAELRNEDLVSGNLGEPLSRPRHIHGTNRDYEYGLNRTNIQFVLEHNILLKRFTLSGGLVAVKNSWSEMNMRVYPSVDASLRIGNGWKVYASYNTSLRMPSATELYYNSKGYNANKNLKPEELSAVEVGVKYQSLPVQGSVSVYHNHMTNLIDWIIDNNSDSPVLTTTNFGKINALGVEASLNINFTELLPTQHFLKSLNVGYAYIDQDQKKYEGITSQYVLEYLRHKLVANLQTHIWKNLNLGIIYRYQKRNGQYTSGYDEATGTNLFSKYHPYSLVDARLSWDAEKYQLYVEGNNLLDHTYVDFGRLPQPGIWIMAGGSINVNL